MITWAQEQHQEATKFLGIPIDGYKTEMKEKLIAKGFIYDSQNDCFNGEFNGHNVNLLVVTNNNKVWRIMLADVATANATDIKIRFNSLCRQFEKNPKYSPWNLSSDSYSISEDEDISFQITVKRKRYEASYIQLPEQLDSTALLEKVQKYLDSKYTQEQLDNLSEDESIKLQKDIFMSFVDEFSKRCVWFMIKEEGYDCYRIYMFYDNEWNHSNGEDL